MKHLITLFLSLTVLTSTFGQSEKAAYWVVETNNQQRNYSIVRFYNSNNDLIHEVNIDKVYIDIRKAKHRKKIDHLLKNYQTRSVETAKRNKSNSSI